MQFTHILAKI